MRNSYEATFVSNAMISKEEAQRVTCIAPRTKESEKFVFYFGKIRVFNSHDNKLSATSEYKVKVQL